MSTVKLFNNGERTIQFGNGKSLAPKSLGVLSKQDADLVKRLYGDEVRDLEDVKADFEDKADAAVDEAKAQADSLKQQEKDADKAAKEAAKQEKAEQKERDRLIGLASEFQENEDGTTTYYGEDNGETFEVTYPTETK